MSDSSAFQAGYAAGAIVGVLLILGVIVLGVVSIIMAFVRRTAGWIVAAIIFSVLGAGGVLTGVVIAARGFGQAIAQQSKPKTVVSSDGWVRLQIPGSWRTLPELHKDASLKVGNKYREEYAIVISEEKVHAGVMLDNFAKVATGSIYKNLTQGAQGPIENATAGEFPARRCRIAGKVDNLPVVYLHYSIETPEGWHQLIMWTLQTKERTAWPVFERVAKSFQVARPPKSGALEPNPKPQPRIARNGTVAERLRAIFVEVLEVPVEKVKPDARLKEDLKADELDLVELVMASEEEFDIEIPEDDEGKLTTVRGFTEYVSSKVK